MDIRVGDRLKLKKQHPCGSFTWLTLRQVWIFESDARGVAMRSCSRGRNWKREFEGSIVEKRRSIHIFLCEKVYLRNEFVCDKI